jgi:hypothetical protein
VQTNLVIRQNQTISSPGSYGVLNPGITITLGNWTLWAEPGQVKIKDLTGQSNPNITVIPFPGGGGTIDGQQSATIMVANEALAFTPFLNGNQWIIE